MMDFHIKRTGRRCHGTDRELKAGEEFFSDLVSVDGVTERHDFCAEAWDGPNEKSIGWWRCSIPVLQSGRVYWAPRDVLVAYFESLQEDKNNLDSAYVMALLLLQKRIVKLIDSTQQDEVETLEISNARDKKTYNVQVVELNAEQVSRIQQQLAEQLFTDRPADQN